MLWPTCTYVRVSTRFPARKDRDTPRGLQLTTPRARAHAMPSHFRLPVKWEI